jgi:cytochrome c oxidase subunit 2
MKRKFLLAVFCVAVMPMTSAISATGAGAQAAPQRIDITAKRFAFTPGEITIKKGQPVVLVLKSEDVNHGLRIRDFGINIQVKAGGTVEVKFTPDKTGDFVGHCSVFCGAGHGSMEIKLHVVA